MSVSTRAGASTPALLASQGLRLRRFPHFEFTIQLHSHEVPSNHSPAHSANALGVLDTGRVRAGSSDLASNSRRAATATGRTYRRRHRVQSSPLRTQRDSVHQLARRDAGHHQPDFPQRLWCCSRRHRRGRTLRSLLRKHRGRQSPLSQPRGLAIRRHHDHRGRGLQGATNHRSGPRRCRRRRRSGPSGQHDRLRHSTLR